MQNQSTHVIMPKKLAQALMEAGMQHYAGGGPVIGQQAQPGGGPPQGAPGIPEYSGTATQSNFSPLADNQYTNPGGIFGGNSSFMNQVFNPIGSMLPGALGMTQNQFQASAPNIETQNFAPGIGLQEANQQGVFGQQQGLASTLAQQAAGSGPNPALSMLNQQTGQNIANQASMAASQRGASANPMLAARLASQAGTQAQQQSIQAASTMQAQQQLAAEQQLAAQQATMAGQSLQGQSILQGGQAAQNTALTSGQLGAQQINANTSAQNQGATNGLIGGLLGGVGSALGAFFSGGGEVRKMDDGGIANYSAPAVPNIPAYQPPPPQQSSGKGGGGAGIASLAALLAQGGNVPYGQMLAGGNVPGKAKIKGDSKKNDTVPTLLSPGEVVIPRSIAQGSNAPEKAAEFIRHLRSRKGA